MKSGALGKFGKIVPRPVWRMIKRALLALPSRAVYQQAVVGKKALEIGGPSDLFATIVPVYPSLAALDGVNFSTNTIWEGAISRGPTYKYYGGRTGMQYIAEAANLVGIADGSYEAILSSNCLEHCANPLKALMEWRRVCVTGGGVVLALPNRENNFDRARPVTPFAHLVADYEQGTGEDDLTHLPEILELHDLDLDPPAGTIEQFKARSRDNFHNRTLHHHVFDLDVMAAMFAFAGLTVVQMDKTPNDLIALGRVT